MHFSVTTHTAIAPNQLYNLFRLVLKSGVKLIRKCGFTRNNQQPWVSYINEMGQSCSHFLKKSLFAGYCVETQGNWATVTDLSRRTQHNVKLDSFYCSCELFKKTNARVRCQHIEEVAKLCPDLEKHIKPLAKSVAPEFEVGDRVRVSCVVNDIKQKRLGVVTALSQIGVDTDLIVKLDGSGEYKRFELSEAEKWGASAVPVPTRTHTLTGYKFGARTAQQIVRNQKLMQAMRM